jgi:Uma2 family endonuclease
MTSIVPQNQSSELAERGWRMELVTRPDGTTDFSNIPLSEAEFLHPKEGYRLPNNTFHDQTISDARDLLSRRYANNPEVAVFSDLLIKWDIDLDDHSPDICVVFGIHQKEENRTTFVVEEEGVRPALILEVVSPRYRKADRETKVLHYARAGVREYIIIDRRRQRGQLVDEVLGYRLVEGQYIPLTPDEEGRIYCQTVELSIGLQEGRVVMVDARTGERLLTSLEWEQRAIQAEQRAARLAELLRSQGIDPGAIA